MPPQRKESLCSYWQLGKPLHHQFQWCGTILVGHLGTVNLRGDNSNICQVVTSQITWVILHMSDGGKQEPITHL